MPSGIAGRGLVFLVLFGGVGVVLAGTEGLEEPVAHLAERLGVDRDEVWSALEPPAVPEPVRPASAAASRRSANGRKRDADPEMAPLF